MANYTFICRNHKCKLKEFTVNVPIMKRDELQVCPTCKKVTTKRKVTAPFFRFADDVNKTISTKDDRYWEGAERAKQQRLTRAQEIRKEKIKYRDPKMIASIRRRIKNEEHLGIVMRDTPRLVEAAKLKKMIGDDK